VPSALALAVSAPAPMVVVGGPGPTSSSLKMGPTLDDLPCHLVAQEIARRLPPASRASLARASRAMRAAVEETPEDVGATERLRSRPTLTPLPHDPRWSMYQFAGSRYHWLWIWGSGVPLLKIEWDRDDQRLHVLPTRDFSGGVLDDDGFPRVVAAALAKIACHAGLSEGTSEKRFTQLLRVRSTHHPIAERKRLAQMVVDGHAYLVKRDSCYGKSIAPRPRGSEASSTRRCAAATRAGTRCTRACHGSSKVCSQHARRG